VGKDHCYSHKICRYSLSPWSIFLVSECIDFKDSFLCHHSKNCSILNFNIFSGAKVNLVGTFFLKGGEEDNNLKNLTTFHNNSKISTFFIKFLISCKILEMKKKLSVSNFNIFVMSFWNLNFCEFTRQIVISH